MLERFSERAKKVMLLADQAAVRCNSDTIRTEHLLCGLLKEGAGVGSSILHDLNIDFKAVRKELDAYLQPCGEGEPGGIAQSPHVKKVIEYAIDEARHLNHHLVGTEHLLLGLLREQDGVAGKVLAKFGLRLGEVRDEVRKLLEEV
jgi:ATP-dependent Clp protease ATP-binding subunit ClpC